MARLAFDSAGNLYITDSGNSRVLELAAAGGTTIDGAPMSADDLYRVVGRSGCASGTGGNGTQAGTAGLLDPLGIKVSDGDLYVADSGNNRVVEDYGGGWAWGQPMTVHDLYTVAGSQAGAGGNNGAGGAATSALLSAPEDISFSSAGDMYIAVSGNNKIQEVASSSGPAQWGLPGTWTANDIYNVLGDPHGASGACTSGTQGPGNSSCLLDNPAGIVINNGTNMYVAEASTSYSNVVEVAQAAHTEWGISMAQFDLYRIAGNGAAGFSGDGGTASGAKLNAPDAISVGGSMYVADTDNDRVRFVDSSGTISEYAGTGCGIPDIGNGAPAFDAGLYTPQGEAFDPAGDVYIADAGNNRIQEIAAYSHSQYGISMTAGDVYTIAGSAKGVAGFSGDGGSARGARLDQPMAVAIDGSGNLYVADSLNCRVREVTVSGTISTVAGDGSGCGTGGFSGAGGPATSAALSAIEGVAVDAKGDVYIADTFFDQAEEVYAPGGQAFGRSSSVAGDLYVIAGTGTAGSGGGGGAATSAGLYLPAGLGLDGAGDVYVSDEGNNRIEEVPVAAGAQHGLWMAEYHLYTIAGPNSAACTAFNSSQSSAPFCPSGNSGDGGPARSALMNGPGGAAVDAAGDVYIADSANNRVREVPAANGTQWGQAMTGNDIYNVAGSASGTSGFGGDGGPAASALFSHLQNVSLDSAGDVYVTDGSNNRLREVVSATPATITPAPGQTSALYPAPGGITVTEPGGAQVTFYSQSGGACPAAPYTQVAGQYCALPQDVGSALAFSSPAQAFTFTQQPGSTFTYNTAGQLTGEADAAGDSLAITYGQVAPGSGNCPSAASWCQVITSASGRALTLGYDNASPVSQVTTVTDPLGRRWAYAYAGSSLTSVTDPRGYVTSYGYDTGNASPVLVNDIVTITQPDGQAGGPDAGAHTSLAWDSSGRVTSVTGPMGYQASYDWGGFNPSTGTGIVTVTDPDGNATVYDYSQGTLAAQSAWNGPAGSGTKASEQDYVPDQAAVTGDASAGTQLDTATADGNGNITTTQYDSNGSGGTNGNPAAVTAPDGVGGQAAVTTQQSTALDMPDCAQAVIAAAACARQPGRPRSRPAG